MSKDKGSKNVKKTPAAEGKKAASDYQAGKNTLSKELIPSAKKSK